MAVRRGQRVICLSLREKRPSLKVVELHPRGWLHGMSSVILERIRKKKLHLIVRR